MREFIRQRCIWGYFLHSVFQNLLKDEGIVHCWCHWSSLVGWNGFKYIELLVLLVNEPFFNLRINVLVSEKMRLF